MPNILPGVKVFPEDKSDFIRLSVSMIQAMVGEFERGPDDIPALVTGKNFKTIFGEIANTSNKKSYISAVRMLKEAEGIRILNVTKDAEYGGIFITDKKVRPFVTGITDRTPSSFNFRLLVTDEVIATGDGSTLTFTTEVDYPTVYQDTAILKFTIGSTDFEVTGVTAGNVTTFTDAVNLTSATLNNITGIVALTFAAGKFPDNNTNITMTYRKDYNDYIRNEIVAIGDGSTLSFVDIILDNYGIVPGSTTLKFTIGASDFTVTDVDQGNGTGTYTDATNLSSGVITYNQNNQAKISLVFLATKAPDNNTNITLSYEQDLELLTALVARSKKSWSDNYGIIIDEVDTVENSFKIDIYQKTVDLTERLLEEFNVSRDPNKIDGFGKNIYIETIFENESSYFYAINNTAVVNTVLPPVTVLNVYADGGNNGITPTSVEYAAAIQKFIPTDIDFDLFVGAGITEKTVIDEIKILVDYKKKEAFIDSISGSQSVIKTWIDTILNLDARNLSGYADNENYVSYEGVEYLCPLSALAAEKQARRVIAGQPFMPPAGIGEDRGSVDIVRSTRYWTDPEIRELHKSNFNVLKFIPGQGNVLFSDFTLQKKLSATSYQNAVKTLNAMITEFEKALLIINFRTINDQTFIIIEALIDGYLQQLIQYEGTIESDYTISFDRNDAVSKDAGKVLVDLIVVFQQLAREIELRLTYTSNTLYSEIAG